MPMKTNLIVKKNKLKKLIIKDVCVIVRTQYF